MVSQAQRLRFALGVTPASGSLSGVGVVIPDPPVDPPVDPPDPGTWIPEQATDKPPQAAQMPNYAVPDGFPTPLTVGLTVPENTLVDVDTMSAGELAAQGLEKSSGGQIRAITSGATCTGVAFGFTRIRTTNFTFENCTFTQAVVANESSYVTDGLVLRNCKARWDATVDSGFVPLRGSASLIDCDLAGGGDTIKGYVGLTIQNCVIWGNRQPPGSHADSFQTQSGSTYRLLNSTFINSVFGNAAIYFDADQPIDDFIVDGCYAAGSANLTMRLSGQMSNGIVRNTIIQQNVASLADGNVWNPIQNSPDSGGSAAVLTNNQLHDPVADTYTPL